MTLSALLRARIAPHFSEGAPGYDPCHDIFHLDRVARLAERIATEHGADVEVVTCAAYLHDLDRAPASGDARSHLAAVGASPALVERVLEAVERHKDKSFAPGGVRPRSLEAAVLSDADKLEAIGAIGVARAFSYGGLKGRPLWDEADVAARPVGPYVSGASGSTIDHFYQKLLRLQGDFATETGRRMARERHAFLETFLERFFDEWRAVDAQPVASGTTRSASRNA